MGGFRLYLVVFLSGASVLALEILGTRILGPFYGVSLFLWSALITVTLAALSVGYAVGGRFADRSATPGRLGSIVGAAGLWVLLIPLLKTPALHATESLGLRAAVLTTATLLFVPPLTLLGMVSPLAVRLRASSLDHVGRTTGNLYAVSTLASVAAALAMGFFLIPEIGVTRLTYSIGLVLLAAGIIAALGAGGARGRVAALVILVGAAAGLAAVPEERADPASGLLAIAQSSYAEIRVVEKNGLRHLLIDGGMHAVVEPETWRSWHPYNAALDVLKPLHPEPGDLLLVGLGGGCLAKRFTTHGWSVQAVEIDPVVGRIAEEFFGLTDADAERFYEDGRRFLERAERRWDVIILDAFGSSSIPFHLVTAEAFGLARERLNPGGILALNMEARGWDDPLVASLAASLRLHFASVWALPTSEPPDQLGNVILLASAGPLEFDEYTALPRPRDHLGEEHSHFWAVELTHAWDNRFEPDAAGALLLTDDRNPVDLWSESINLQARAVLHRYFDDQGGGW